MEIAMRKAMDRAEKRKPEITKPHQARQDDS